MKKLLCLVAVMFILGTSAYSEAAYTLSQQKKIELEAKLKTLELIKEKNARRKNETGNEDVKNEAAHKELRRLDEEIERIQEELRKLNDADKENAEKIRDVKPNYKDIG
jgi:septal ring factor EnvC (AmiA/AmiB activator)